MKKNLLLIIFLNCFLILGFSSNIFAKKAAIVIDFDTEEVLFEVNADTRNYPASLTKIMTLYIVFDYIKKGKLSYDSQLSVSNIAASRSPSKLYLEAGSSIKVRDAVNALIIKSANDVATVVSENISGSEKEFAKLMTRYAKNLGMHFALIDKRRFAPNQTEINHLIGRLENMDVLIIDDMIDTAGTLVNAASAAINKGAKSVTAFATHGVLSDPAIDRIGKSNIKKVIITDTISVPKHKLIDKLKIISVSNIFGQAVDRVHNGESVSALFEF